MMDEFTDSFFTLACCDAELLEPQQVKLYIVGLDNPLKTNVALRRPQTLDDTIMFARAYEQHL